MAYNASLIGWMTEYDLRAIEMLANQVPSTGTIVEIGSMFGKSSTAFAMTCPTATILCIDMFPDEIVPNETLMDAEICTVHGYPLPSQIYNISQEFDKNMQQFSNVTKVVSYSPYELEIEIPDIDLFFLDALHENPNDWDNIERFLPHIKETGIIAGHDYGIPYYPDVADNVKRLEILLGKTATLYPHSSIWSIQK